MMDPDLFKARARALLQWVQGESGRVFYVNGYLGHKLKWSESAGRLTIIEADNGGADYPGEEVHIEAKDVEDAHFSYDEYKFMIATTEESEHGGQGYDIEAYELQRIEYESEES